MRPLIRGENESEADFVQRFLVDPLCGDSTDVEIAAALQVKLSVVREQQSRRLALREALQVANDIDWPDDAYSLIRAALVDFALAYCRDGRCSHPKCKTPLLAELAERGIVLRLVDGDRFVSDPKKLSDDDRTWIVERRAAIVAEFSRL